MKKFEYRVVDHDFFGDEEPNLMNYLGAKGWEVIKICDAMKYLNSDGMFIRIYYKRPLKEALKTIGELEKEGKI